MNPKKALALFLVFSMILILAPGTLAETLTFRVWVLNSLERAEIVSAAGANQIPELYALKGETTSFQVVVQAPAIAPLTLNGLTISDLISLEGAIIPSSSVDLYREHFLFVSTNQHSEDKTGSNHRDFVEDHWYPDALIPFMDPATGVAPLDNASYKSLPFLSEKGENSAFWFDVKVPVDAVPGVYSASYMVETDSGVFHGNLVLTVWNYEMPIASMSYTMIPETTKDLNNLKMFLSNHWNTSEQLDKETYDQVKILGQRYNSTNFWGNVTWGVPASNMLDAPVREDVQTVQKGFEGEGMRWINYTIDEIGTAYDEYLTRFIARMLSKDKDYFKGSHDLFRQKLYDWHKVLSEYSVQQLVVTRPYLDMLDDTDLGGKGDPLVDIFVMLGSQYNEPYINKNGSIIKGITAADVISAAQEKGCQVWSYTAMVQDNYSPTWALDYSLINYRILPGFLNQAMGFTGTLYWRANWFQNLENPWVSLTDGYQIAALGEGILVYPGEQAGLIEYAPSIRLKAMRDGVYDYDYVQMLKDEGYSAQAAMIVSSVATDYKNWTKDNDTLLRARKEMGKLLDAIGNGEKP